VFDVSIETIDAPAAIEQLSGDRRITNLMFLIWRSRKDLQQAFDLHAKDGQEALTNWYDVFINPDYGISSAEATLNATGSFDLSLGHTLLSMCLEKLEAPAKLVQFSRGYPITNLLHLIWHCRKDLQRAFDIQTEGGQEALIRWYVVYAKREYGFSASAVSQKTNSFDYDLGQALLSMWLEATIVAATKPGHFLEKNLSTDRMLLILFCRRKLQKFFEFCAKAGKQSLRKWKRRFRTKKYRIPPRDAAQYEVSIFDRNLGQALLNTCREVIEAPAEIEQFLDRQPINKLMLLIWRSRRDLQQAFDLKTKVGQESLVGWCNAFAYREYGIPPTDANTNADGAFVRNWGRIGNAPPLSLCMLEKATRAIARAAYGRAIWRQSEATATKFPPEFPPGSEHGTPEKQYYGGDAGVNLIGYVYTESGVGEHIRMSAAALSEANVPFGMVNFTIGIPSRQNASFDRPMQIDNKYKTNLLHINADHMLTTYLHFGKSFFAQRYNIFYCFWELSKFPRQWTEIVQLFGLDEVWAPSTFIQTAVSEALGKAVPYMPVSIVLPAITRLGRNYFGIPPDRYLFLSTFDFYSHIDRKNPWAVVAAFNRAFPSGSENVGLIIKVMNAYESTEKWTRLVHQIGDDKRIRIINETMDKSELLSLKSECDCYVSLHRAEGLGMGPLEAMLLGKPVIVTNYSGSTDYAKPDNACLVDYSLIPVLKGEYIFHENQVWADPDVEHAAWYMKKLANDKAYGVSLGKKSAEFVSTQFSPARCGHLYKQRLMELGLL
jgi:glycosyltransferase involved in cell wall biosynthesis